MIHYSVQLHDLLQKYLPIVQTYYAEYLVGADWHFLEQSIKEVQGHPVASTLTEISAAIKKIDVNRVLAGFLIKFSLIPIL
jgi:hypothetical protein